MAYATGSTGLAITVRGSSRRIMIMRFRPANIRLINRRSKLLRLLLALSSGNENANHQNKPIDLAQLTRSLHIRPIALIENLAWRDSLSLDAPFRHRSSFCGHSPSQEAKADALRNRDTSCGGRRRFGVLVRYSPSLRFRANILYGGELLSRKFWRNWKNPESVLFCSALWQRFSHGAFNGSMQFHTTDFRSIVPRFSAEKMKANQNLVEIAAPYCGEEERDPGSDCSGAAVRREVMDRPYSRHHQAASVGAPYYMGEEKTAL